MPEGFVLPQVLQLAEIASHHRDVTESLRLYFSPANPSFAGRFVGKRKDEFERELASRIEESDVRSTFFVLTAVEAALRLDFERRCKRRLKDNLSKYFRAIHKRRKSRAPLDEIIDGWIVHEPSSSRLLHEVRATFGLGHWLAHGRFWIPKLGRRYDFAAVYLLAEAVITGLGLEV